MQHDLDPKPHWDGLDVTCGPGLTTAALAERLPQGRTPGRTLGVDFAEPMIARARERFSNPRVSFASTTPSTSPSPPRRSGAARDGGSASAGETPRSHPNETRGFAGGPGSRRGTRRGDAAREPPYNGTVC